MPGGDPSLEYYAERFCSNLSPVLESDGELLDRFCSALRSSRVEEVRMLNRLASSIRELRNCFSVNAIPTLAREQFDKAVRFAPAASEGFKAREPETERFLGQALELERPSDMPVEKYLEIILPYKPKLQAIVASILSKSNGEKTSSFSSLLSIVSDINEQIRIKQKSRRYQTVQASIALANANQTLLRSILIGGTVGLCSSIFGCATTTMVTSAGISSAAAAGMRVLKKAKSSEDPRVTKLKQTLTRDLKTIIEPAMAAYLDMSLHAMQVWEVRKSLQNAGKRSKKLG